MRRIGWGGALALAVLGALMGSAVAQAADFLGPETCKGCHPEAYLAWKQSKHAHALDVLSAQQQHDARCLTCHAPHLQEQGVAQVTCETCHGGGQYYAPSYVMKDPELARLVGLLDPSERSCRACHDSASPSLKPFDFAEKLKLLDHWTQERQRRGLAPASRPGAGAARPTAPSAPPSNGARMDAAVQTARVDRRR